jgi:hypothetical protein
VDKTSQKEGSISHFDYTAVIQRIPQPRVLYESARLASHFFGIPYAHDIPLPGETRLSSSLHCRYEFLVGDLLLIDHGGFERPAGLLVIHCVGSKRMAFSGTRGSTFLRFRIVRGAQPLCILQLITRRRMAAGARYEGEGFLEGQREPVVVVYELDTGFSVLRKA